MTIRIESFSDGTEIISDGKGNEIVLSIPDLSVEEMRIILKVGGRLAGTIISHLDSIMREKKEKSKTYICNSCTDPCRVTIKKIYREPEGCIHNIQQYNVKWEKEEK